MKDSSKTIREPGPHVSEDVMLDLLHNLLPGPESDRVLAHMAVCPLCEACFRERVAERERLRAARVIRAVSGGDLVVARPEVRTGADGGTRAFLARRWAGFMDGFRLPRYRLAGGLVAAVAVLMLVVLPRLGGPPEDDALVWLPASFDDARLRSSSPEGWEDDLASGLEAYAKQDVDRAARLLGRVEASGNLETVRKVYLGNALAWKGEYAKAAEVLEDVVSRALPDPWGSEAWWTLYVALRRSGRTAQADSLLSILAAEPGELGQRARREEPGAGGE